MVVPIHSWLLYDDHCPKCGSYDIEWIRMRGQNEGCAPFWRYRILCGNCGFDKLQYYEEIESEPPNHL